MCTARFYAEGFFGIFLAPMGTTNSQAVENFEKQTSVHIAVPDSGKYFTTILYCHIALQTVEQV
jgi:hypothetical protein